MSVQELRLVTIVGPMVFLLGLAALGIIVFHGGSGIGFWLRLSIILVLLAVAVIPFSFWIFVTIERQQRDLARSAALLESVREHAIFMLNAAGNIVTWSPGATRLEGYTPEEIIGRHLSTFYTPEDVAIDRPQDTLDRTAAEGRHETEGWRLRKDGTRFWANVVSTAAYDGRGQLTGFTHVVTDMTERRMADERIHRLNEELEQRVGELHTANLVIARHNVHLGAINAAIHSISSAIELEQVLQKITDAARNVVRSRYAALGVADEHGRLQQFTPALSESGASPNAPWTKSARSRTICVQRSWMILAWSRPCVGTPTNLLSPMNARST